MTRRVVFDTNVLVSGYLWKGVPRRALEKIRNGEWTLLTSNATLEELIRVLGYEKFGLQAEEIEPIIRDLLSMGQFVDVRTTVEIIQNDPTDNMFLALAVDGKAQVIVSGDHHLLDLNEFRGIPILSVRQFLFHRPNWSTAQTTDSLILNRQVSSPRRD